MRKHILSLGHDSLVYGIGSVAQRMAGIITLPIYARVFAPGQLADIELATATYSLLAGVLDLGLTSAFIRSFFDFGDDPEGTTERQLIVSTAFTVILANTLLIASVFVLFKGFVNGIVFVHANHERLVLLVGLMIPPGMVAWLTSQLLRVGRRRRAFVILTGSGSIVTLALGPALILGFHLGLQAVLIGQLAGFTLSAVYGVWVTRRWLKLRFSRAHLVQMLKYGLPFLPTAAAFWAVSLIDRFMIERLSSLNQLGQYAVAYRVTSLIPMLLFGFSTAYGPFIMRLWSDDPDLEKRVRGRTFTYVAIIISFVAVVLSLFAREIVDVVAPSYHLAYKAVGLILIGICSYGLCSVLGAGMSLTRKTYWNMAFSAVGAAVNIGLNVFLIPVYGMVGAAFATAVGYGVITLLYYLNGQRIYHTPYEGKKVLGTMALAVVAGAFGRIAYPNEATALLVKAAVVVAFLVAIVALGIVRSPRMPGWRRWRSWVGIPREDRMLGR